MAMEIVLDLQKLEVPQEEDLFGSSTGSSSSGCCNGQHQTNLNCNCNSRLSKGDRSKGLGTETGLLPKEFRAQFKRSSLLKTRFTRLRSAVRALRIWN